MTTREQIREEMENITIQECGKDLIYITDIPEGTDLYVLRIANGCGDINTIMWKEGNQEIHTLAIRPLKNWWGTNDIEENRRRWIPILKARLMDGIDKNFDEEIY